MASKVWDRTKARFWRENARAHRREEAERQARLRKVQRRFRALVRPPSMATTVGLGVAVFLTMFAAGLGWPAISGGLGGLARLMAP